MHVPGECPSQVKVDEENCKSSVGLGKALTREDDTIVKQKASGQDHCDDCVYAVVEKTLRKRQPAKVNKAVWLNSLIVLSRF